MSQQQINKISAETYLEKAQNTLKKQADAYYLKEHFRVGTEYDKNKFILNHLFSEILCTNDCEILNWIDRKIRGKLEGDIKLSKDKKIEPTNPDIIINNYYNTEAKYEEVEW